MSREHLTLEERQNIEQMLNAKQRLVDIAKAIGKHLSTISREIKAHLVVRRTGTRGRAYNNCAKRFSCIKSKLCYPCKSDRKHQQCRHCIACNTVCKDYVPAVLPQTRSTTLCMQRLWHCVRLYAGEASLFGGNC